ncbi:hypothetical protein MBLNU459_g2387t1 [Dothideomycetes sp. NU459]
MGKLLLTSGQVSFILSSSIVGIFTLVIFLCGYVLQQKTVAALQETLKPKIPVAPPPNVTPLPLAASLQASRAFGGSMGSSGHVAFQDFLTPQESAPPTDWKNLAHVQVVREHESVCNAIMLFGELHRLKSPARRILLFPKAWAKEKQAEKGDASDPYMESSRRLLRRAARRYRVELRPIDTLLDGANEDLPSSYSLASVYGLKDVSRAMILSTPGLLQDATPLDSVLAYAPYSPVALLQANETTMISESDLLLAAPAGDSWAALRSSDPSINASDIALVQRTLPEALKLESSSDESQLVRSIGTLHSVARGFSAADATAYLSSAAYIRFSDPKLPGPEYDVPYADKVKARPRNKDADWVWTKLYGSFAQKRMDICGLDLEPWREY